MKGNWVYKGINESVDHACQMGFNPTPNLCGSGLGSNWIFPALNLKAHPIKYIISTQTMNSFILTPWNWNKTKRPFESITALICPFESINFYLFQFHIKKTLK